MKEGDLTYSKLDRTARITLSKAPANGYNYDYLVRIAELVVNAEEDPGVKIVLIESGLDKFFCAGADINDFADNTSEQNAKMAEAARRLTHLITAGSKIYVATIAGHCLGGGLEIALACDIRLAASGNYKLGLPEVRLGVMPGDGGAARLIRLIGAGKAMEVLITGNSFTIQRAYELGIVNQVYANDFNSKVSEYVMNLAAGSLTAMSKIKEFNRRQSALSLEEALDLEKRMVLELYDTHDAVEGFNAFVEKRKPKYQ